MAHSIPQSTQLSTNSMELGQVLAQVQAGAIRIPDFQRSFRWDVQDVIRLLDSINRGFPIGTLLLWQRPAPEAKVQLGDLLIEAPKNDQALWVVDGQQRITSLANVFLEDFRQNLSNPVFDVVYNAEEERYTSASTRQSPFLVPLPTLFNSSRLVQWAIKNSELTPFIPAMSAASDRLNRYSIPQYTVKADDQKVLEDIFDRMNTYGKRLRRNEVFSALFPSTDETTGDRVKVSDLSEDCFSKTTFGLIDSDTALSALLARRGPDTRREIRSEFTREPPFGDFPMESQADAYRGTQESLLRAVTFLQEVGVPHFSFLPYRYLLVVLTRFFSHFPSLHSWNRHLLERWFWRAALIGPASFRGNIIGATRQLSKFIIPGEETASVSRLTQWSKREKLADTYLTTAITRFRTNEANGKLLLCGLWSAAPRNPQTGQVFNQADVHLYLEGQTTANPTLVDLFPRTELPNDVAQGLANRVLLPTEDRPQRLSQLLFDSGESLLSPAESLEVSRSHFIPTEHPGLKDSHSESDLAYDFAPELLRLRNSELTDRISRWLDLKCEWNRPDLAPLDRLVLDDVPESPDELSSTEVG